MKSWTDDATEYVKRYLRQVQVRLEGGGADAHEVVEDLSRHIHQRANDSAEVVITIDEARRILATMGSPDEVALSWKQLGEERGADKWDAPEPVPPAAWPKLPRQWWWVIAAVAVLVAGAVVIWITRTPSYVQVSGTMARAEETVHPELLEAARYGHQETVQGLLDRGAVIDLQDSSGMTALHHAAKNGHNGTARLLVQRGANVNIRDRYGKTAADYAAAGGHQETLDAILGAIPQGAATLDRVESSEAVIGIKAGANLPAPWFQAGNDHANYQTGIAAVPGILGDALCIRSTAAHPAGFSTIMAEMPATNYRGRKVTLSGTLRSDIRSGSAGLWLRIDGPQGEVLGFDNMQDRAITGTTAARPYTITLDVPANAASLAYGILFQGEGTIYSSIPELH